MMNRPRVCMLPISMLLVFAGIASVVGFGPSALITLAQPTASEPYTLNSKHYEIVTDMRPREIRDIVNHMDATYESFEHLFSSFRTRNAKATRLYLWSDRAAYVRHGDSLGADLRASGGVFFRAGGEAGVSTWVRDQPKQWLREVLQHEGFHQFAHLRFGDTLPIWMNEGLAVYYQHARMVRGRLLLGTTPRDKIEMLRTGFDSGEAFTFEEMITLTNPEWWRVLNNEPDRAGLMYAQSWAIAHFLIHADNGRYRGMFERYLQRIAQGRQHANAYKEAFGTEDKTVFGERWERYILEELEPDPLSEAGERVEFLAEGLKMLAAEGVMPTSMDELREELQNRSFSFEREHMGVGRTFEATDEMFTAPEPAAGSRRPRGRAPEMKLIHAARGMPPTVRVIGLKAEVRLEWVEAGEQNSAELSYEIVYR